MFEIDITKDPYDKLSEYAKRIATLLEDQTIQGNKDVKGSLDELVGSVYSLIRAEWEGFEDRIDKPKEDAPILKRAQDLGKGSVRTDGKWIAGYYVNSSTYRTAAANHRLLQIITGKDEYVNTLLPIACGRYRQWTGKEWKHDALKAVNGESNKLKHRAEGLYTKRGLDYDNAVRAIDQILTITEAWAKHIAGKP